MAAGEEVKSTTRVETDAGRDDVTVKRRTRTEVDRDAVGTSGAVATFALVPRSDVLLSPHVGRQVELSAVMIEQGAGDAEVQITERQNVDRDDARDSNTRTTTKVEGRRAPPAGE